MKHMIPEVEDVQAIAEDEDQPIIPDIESPK